jgi:hypothetical protein
MIKGSSLFLRFRGEEPAMWGPIVEDWDKAYEEARKKKDEKEK